VSGFPSDWRASRAAPACGSSPLPPPQARQWPEPAERVFVRPSGSPHPVVPRRPASRAPRVQAGRCKPCPPSPAAAFAGPWPLPSRSRARARLAGQHLGETGRGPDSCPYRQPDATSCRASRMFLIACYGLTPRCREVKR